MKKKIETEIVKTICTLDEQVQGTDGRAFQPRSKRLTKHLYYGDKDAVCEVKQQVSCCEIERSSNRSCSVHVFIFQTINNL